MNIVSKSDSEIQVEGGCYLNIIQQSSQNATINNLMINLVFSVSPSNITLFNDITGAFYINNYQILGRYLNQGTVALIGLTINNSNFTAQNININPNTFNVGNYSSFLLCQVVQSQVKFSHVSIVLGNQSFSQVLNQVDSNISHMYQFGGLITNLSQTSSLIIQYVLLNSYQEYITQYIQYSGILLGNSDSDLNNIQFNNICLLQILNNIRNMTYFGLIGYIQGNISYFESNIEIQINKASDIHAFGIYGYLVPQYAEILNVATSVSLQLNNDSNANNNYISALIGVQTQKKCLVQNISIDSSNISSKQCFGTVIGFIFSSNLQVLNCTIQNSNFTTYIKSSGIFIGQATSTQILIVNTQISSVALSCPTSSSMTIGANLGNKFDIQNTVFYGGNNILNNNIFDNVQYELEVSALNNQ
ncbi:Hypothetical_protein [Hexamita inflata]|uniref:Hypothetical_protein n=1 Tax=Hexamita inflata TaxID=28002 RepID=A0AA86PKC3_9EUKA|nr:Hypothetical protein HINF_LOCUS26423 [Hexamita inflata]CAI9964746.1 Hypothetical protein HINF_LOCUS52391 [Hexamita inflata]